MSFARIIRSGDILKELGDCSKLPLDCMDLITRTLRCRNIEIFNYEEEVSFTAEEEEAEGLSFSTEDVTDDEDRGLRLLQDIDCLIRRIELAQMAIRERQQIAETEEQSQVAEPPVPLVSKSKSLLKCQEELEIVAEKPLQLSSQEQLEVRDLQHSHQRLQGELDEMICRFYNLRQILYQMSLQLCSIERELRELSTHAEECYEWTQQVTAELPVCRQRYEFLQDTKITTQEAESVARNHMSAAFKHNRRYLDRARLQYEMREFVAEVDELLEFSEELCFEIGKRFECMEVKAVARNKLVMANFMIDVKPALVEFAKGFQTLSNGSKLRADLDRLLKETSLRKED